MPTFFKPVSRLRAAVSRLTIVTVVMVVVLSAALFFSACGSYNGEGNVVTDGTTATTAATSTTATTAGRMPTVQSIEQAVAAIRELPPPAEIPVSYINRDQLRGELDAQITKSYPPEKAIPEERVLKYLGLIDRNVDLVSEFRRALGEGVIGYYDDGTKQLQVVSDTQAITPLNEITMAHEITHAVEDQNFDLAALTGEAGSGDADRDTAVLSLIEGDATVVEQAYTMQVMSGMDLASALFGSLGALGATSTTPPYLLHSIEFPYLTGSEFVNALYSQGGWQAVNQAYAQPPASTEQVMHPDKYLAGEAPVTVAIPDLSGAIGSGWNIQAEDSIGEFDVRELIGTELPRTRARTAAAGWGGGSYRYYERNGQPLLVLSLVWDSDKDADEFAGGIQVVLAKRYSGSFTGAPVAALSSPDGAWVFFREGNKTALVLASDEGLAAAAARSAII